jgi:hypothetical protein
MDQLSNQFRITPLDRDELNTYRAGGSDAFGNALAVHVNTEEGAAPLRCCLTEATVGERVALIAPFSFEGPFAEVGPAYIHAQPCDGYITTGQYPPDFRHRNQVLRAYGDDNRIHDASLVAGEDAEAVISELLARPDVAFLHSRKPLYGCYMFAIDRPTTADPT